MSAFTRSRTFDRVRFKDSSGKLIEGVVLGNRSAEALVGVQSTVKPMVWGELRNNYGAVRRHFRTGMPLMGMVPNNSLWVVPFGSIVETVLSAESDNAAE